MTAEQKKTGTRSRATENAKEKRQPRELSADASAASKRRELSGALLCLSGIFLFALFIKNAALASALALEGLRICARTIVPALFPFMVISEIFVSSPASALLGRAFQRPARLFFGIGGEGACAVIIGSLCGFPVGASLAVSSYEKGRATKEETERLLAFCNTPSPAFLLGVAGASIFASREIGYMLFFSTLSASLLSGVILNLTSKAKSRDFRDSSPYCDKFEHFAASKSTVSTTSLFVNAVSSSAVGVLKVCGFVVFFNVLSGCLSNLLSSLSASPLLSSILFGTLEITGGVTHSASISPDISALLLAAACCGWSGLSVHCQIASFCAPHNLSLKPYLLSKLIQAPLSALFMYLWFFLRTF